MNKEIELSIIIPTLGRKDQVDSLLESIMKSNHKYSFEIIIVDQNQNDILDSICCKYESQLPIKRHKVNFRGVSLARNYGSNCAVGKVLCFPDDDAEFLPETINNAFCALKKANCVFGKVINKEDGKDVIMKFKKNGEFLKLDNFEGRFVEATMFVYKALILKYPFDINLGVGTIHGSQEGYDLVYRMLKDGIELYFDPAIVFYHPDKVLMRTTEAEIKRAFYYSSGFAYLCKKHNFRRKYLVRLIKISLALPLIFMFKHREYGYFHAQKLGLLLGYRYI